VPELIQNRVTERVDRSRHPAPQVKNPAHRPRIVEASDPHPHHIVDKYEISRLLAVTVDSDGFAA